MWILIPILALLVPISAIALNSAVGKAIAEQIRERGRGASDPGTLGRLEWRVAHLESALAEAEDRIGKLQEDNRFLHRLLSDR